MGEEYSDDELEEICSKVKKWYELFSKSRHFEELTQEQKKEAEFVVTSFAEYMYSYHLLSPEEWDEYLLEDCCVNILPRKVTADESFFKSVAPVLSAFFAFTEENGLLKNSSVLAERVKKIHEQVIMNAANPEYWGMAKSFLMTAKNAGVNIEDERELNSFAAFLNLQLMRQPKGSVKQFGKVGRNQPCPCGSGKKYKKCCGRRNGLNTPKYRVRRGIHWSTGEVRAFPTEQIIQKLRGFGVEFKEEQFLKDVNNFYSACDLADHWREIYPIAAEGLDEDFIWMAAVVLWERLAPHVVNSEQIDEMMQKGYDLLRERKEVEACTLWLEVWKHLKRRFSPDMKSIQDAERVFSGFQSLYNWCQDMEMELGNAGIKDTSFYERRIKYCQEFCALFPKTDSLIIQNMKRAEAESYFALGMLEPGEAAFETLIREFPNSPWGYIGWGDMYWLSRMNDKIPLNYEKAERIYQMALARNVEDKEDVLDRLKELEGEREKRKREKS